MLPTEWIHIEYRGGDPWVLPIWNAIHKAKENDKIKSYPEELKELAISISTRLDMIPKIAKRIDRGCDSIFEKVKTHNDEDIFTSDNDGYAFPIDNDLKFGLLIDIDSFLFEINSCSDFIKRFMEINYRNVGININESELGKKMQEIIHKGGGNTDWFKKLDNLRNHFIHEATPYFAVDISNASNGKYDLLITKEHLKKFNDESKFVRLGELKEIAQGFIASKTIIQKDIIRLYDSI